MRIFRLKCKIQRIIGGTLAGINRRSPFPLYLFKPRGDGNLDDRVVFCDLLSSRVRDYKGSARRSDRRHTRCLWRTLGSLFSIRSVSRMIPPQSLTMMSLYYAFNRGYRAHPDATHVGSL